MIGRFNYRSMATMRDRGSVRKERFAPLAFDYSIERDPAAKIDILVGHSFDKPIASRQAGTLNISHTAEAVTFEAMLPADPPSWVVDVEKAIDGGVNDFLIPRLPSPAPRRGSQRRRTFARTGQPLRDDSPN